MVEKKQITKRKTKAKTFNKKKKGDKSKLKRKFNIYWIYGLIAAGFFIIQFFNVGQKPVEITWHKFEIEMLRNHEV